MNDWRVSGNQEGKRERKEKEENLKEEEGGGGEGGGEEEREIGRMYKIWKMLKEEKVGEKNKCLRSK